MKRITFLTICICVIIVLVFFVFIDSTEDSMINLIDRFDEATRSNFNDGRLLDSYMPENTYVFNVSLLNDISESVFSSNDRFKIKNMHFKNSLQFIDGAIRLKFGDIHLDSATFKFSFTCKSGSEFKAVYKPSRSSERLQVSERNGKSDKVIANISFTRNRSDSNILLFLFANDYFIIFDNSKVLFQMKSKEINGEKTFQSKVNTVNSSELNYILRLQDLSSGNVKELMEYQNHRVKTVPEHIYNSSMNLDPWNILFDRRFLKKPDEQTSYLRRLKREEKTIPSIYFQMNSSLEYKLKLPEAAVLEYQLTALPKFIHDPGRVKFDVKITHEDGKNIYSQSLTLDKLSDEIDTFHFFRKNLSSAGGETCILKFSLGTTDGRIEKDEDKIIVALGSPVILTKRSKDEKNVILISLDTLRSDRLSCYGYKRKTSPSIDAIADEGTKFLNCTSNSNWTLPSHLSIFTAMFPFETGHAKGILQHESTFLADELTSLPQHLSKAGYFNIGLHGGGYVSEIYGFDKGFNCYVKAGRDAKDTIDATLEMLEKYKESKFFMFVHSFEIHDPYTRNIFQKNLPADSSERDKIIAAYDSGIKYTDTQFRRLFDWLKKNGLYHQTLIIITSDHGESFTKIRRDRKCGTHGNTLYDEETHIPLIIAGPEDFSGGNSIENQVSSVDILPTIMRYLDIPIQKEVRGKSLFPLSEISRDSKRIAFSEAVHVKTEKKSLRSLKYKFIRNFPGKKHPLGKNQRETELYDLTEDPAEQENIVIRNKKISQRYSKIMQKIIASIRKNAATYKKMKKHSGSTNDELQKDLQNLGYLGG